MDVRDETDVAETFALRDALLRKRAEDAGECELLVFGDVLVANEEEVVAVDRAAHFLRQVVADWFSQIDAADLGSQSFADGAQFDAGHGRRPWWDRRRFLAL